MSTPCSKLASKRKLPHTLFPSISIGFVFETGRRPHPSPNRVRFSKSHQRRIGFKAELPVLLLVPSHELGSFLQIPITPPVLGFEAQIRPHPLHIHLNRVRSVKLPPAATSPHLPLPINWVRSSRTSPQPHPPPSGFVFSDPILSVSRQTGQKPNPNRFTL